MVSKERVEAHHCHAIECTKKVKPEMLMCYAHWTMVPRNVQRLVWRFYREGQCDDMNPSENWHRAASRAIKSVADKEGRSVSVSCAREAVEPFDKEAE